MATLPLYAKNPRVPNRWARFPDDFTVIGETKVDDEFVEHPEIGGARWFRRCPAKSRTQYAAHVGPSGNGSICLHEVLWRIVHGEPDPGIEIDHVNRDGLDNRLENLRLASRGEQNRNRLPNRNCKSGYKGVDGRIQDNGRWRAYVCLKGGRTRSIGAYDTKDEAAFAYNVAMQHLRDPFSVLNEIPPGTISDRALAMIEELVIRRMPPILKAAEDPTTTVPVTS